MSEESDDDNWLHGAFIHCPQCETRLFRVDRSPFYDDYRIYCDSCANSVEVSYYDDVLKEIEQEIQSPGHKAKEALRAAIERRLRSCDCGGRFAFDAARRCYICGRVIVSDEPWVDLGPAWSAERPDEDQPPTAEDQAFYDEWVRLYVRTENIWR